MKIAQLVPRGEYAWSGILTVIVNLSAALARRGHDVDLWLLAPWDAEMYGDHGTALDEAGVNRVLVPHGGGWSEMGASVARHAQTSSVEIVHLHGAFNRTNTSVSLRLRTPFVFSPHSGYDPISLQRSVFRKTIYARLFERRMHRRASLLSVLTEREREQIRAFGASGPVVVIPNGVMPPPDSDPTAFRRRIGLDTPARLAVYVGRLDIHRKGLDILLGGIAESPEWHLALIGAEERGDLPALIAEIEALGLRQRVTVTGPMKRREVHEALAAAEIFTLFSRWEGMPIALLEALSHGTPALVSLEVEQVIGVESEGAGWVATASSAGRVLTDLTKMEPERWADRRQAAFRLARRFDWDAVATRYEEAYASIIGTERA